MPLYQHVLALAGRPVVPFVLLPVLMLVLVIGTVAQAAIGLYEAQRLFFSSWPTLLLLGGMVFGLGCKFILASRWTWARSGINLAHLGVLILLVGGLLSALLTREGNLVVAEGEESNLIRDYHQRDFSILLPDGRSLSLPFQDIHPGMVIPVAETGFRLTIEGTCRHCKILPRDEVEPTDDHPPHGMARFMALTPAPLQKEDEANMNGLTFILSGGGDDVDGRYIAFDMMPSPVVLDTEDGAVNIFLAKRASALPFSIHLVTFTAERHPGTMMARAYRSDVLVRDAGMEWPVRIEMNKPLRYRGYTLFQSSFFTPADDGPNYTVLAVVENRAWLFPYIGTGILAAGLLLHLIVLLRLRRGAARALMIGAVVIAAMFPATATHAAKMSMADFALLPVLHEGRVKPMESFARVEIRRIHGQSNALGMAPLDLLALALFDPEAVAAAPILPVREDSLRAQMGLSAEGKRVFFSLNELRPGLARTLPLIPEMMQAQSRTPAQESLLDLHERALALGQLMGAMTMLLPLDVALDRESENPTAPPPAPPPAWIDLRDGAHEDVREILQRQGSNNTLLRVIPPAWGGDEEWRSPWAALLSGAGSPMGRDYLTHWRAMADAWRAQDNAAWAAATHSALNAAQAFSPPRWRFDLERAYRGIDPLRWAEGGYMLALLLLAVAFWRGGAAASSSWLYGAACTLTALGALVQSVGLTARSILLDRPPVGTLYETLLFVSLVVVLCGLVIAWRRRDYLSLVAALGCGVALLLAAPTFAPHGDSLEMLVAVLNTSFWLATHVIIITAGYGVCLLAAGLAHFALWRPGAVRADILHSILIAGLFLTAFGTMLGGIWADQSWGRFWGWDPKENGALLIVLWLSWIVHGRYAGLLKGAAYHAAVAWLAVIVALAWFGVNLLNVGLHSYGFTDGMALGLGVFCAVETALVLFALFYWRGRKPA